MSLRVWLPLNGNLNNQGLSDITVTNSGATVDNNGKIGKCYSFGTASSYLEIPPTVMNTFTDECSISMWLYITSWNTNYATIFQAGKGAQPWNHYVFGVLRYSNSSQLCFTITQGTNSSSNLYMTPDLSLATWYHLTFVYKPGHCLIYVNGSLYQDYTTSYTPSFDQITKITVGTSNAITAYQSNCKLNDFRIYDHALSPKEIEILSRGLVCHYPLSGGGRGGDNIMPNSYTMQLGNASVTDGIWRLAGTSNMNRSRVQIDDGFYAFENSGIQTANDGSCYGIDNFVFEANTTYTMSMIARITEGIEGYAGFAVYDATVIGGTHTKYERYYYVTPLTTTWKRIYITFTTASSTTRNIYIGITTGSTSVTTQMALVKIEKGDKSTPWIPKFTDLEYSKMGYDSNIEYDVSGYRNNGTKNGTIAYSSDTARYSVSTVFDGNSASIQIPNLYEMLGSNGSASYSISVWTYKSQIGTKSYQTILGGGSGFEIEARSAAGTDPQYVLWNWGKIAAPYEFNKWNHMVFTKQGSEVKLYVNGVLANQGTSSSAIVNSNYFIGAWNTATQQNYEGQMSDFRIYATALSDTQVAELYNTAVSVANNGALMGYELVEV